MGLTIKKRRKNQTVAVQVGANEKHGPAHAVEPNEIGAAAKLIHVDPAIVAPSIAVERWTARLPHAMRMQDVASGCDHSVN
jgi:hypothetical protein